MVRGRAVHRPGREPTPDAGVVVVILVVVVVVVVGVMAGVEHLQQSDVRCAVWEGIVAEF